MKKKARGCALLLCCLLLLCGCGKAEKKSEPADLPAIYEQILQETGSPGMILLSETKIERLYGFHAEDCPQMLIAISDDGLRIDEIWMIEAKSEEAAAELEVLARERAEHLANETENYLPDQYQVAKEARTVRIGKIVGLFVSPKAAVMEEAFRKAAS